MFEISSWHYWLIAAGLLVGAELFIGSPMFVLLILGAASLVASAAAWFGSPLWAQLLAATTVSISGYALAVHLKKREPQGANLPFDVGERVELIREISTDVAEVSYRGALWKAEADPPGIDWKGALFVKAVRGTTLIVGQERSK